MMQSVSVYLRDGKYFVVTIHGSGGGEPCISSGPVAELPETADASELGGAVLRGLDASTANAPWPKDFKKVTEPLLAAAQAKTWAAFAKRAVSLRVDREGSRYALLPSNRTPKGSFEAAPDRFRNLEGIDAAALGNAIASELAPHSK